jgi:SPP1 family predicted phage head-tail adaptor
VPRGHRIRSGELRHTVTVQALTETNTGGYLGQTYATVGTVRAMVQPMSGAERGGADELTGESTHRIIMRREDGLTDGLTRRHRLLFEGRALDIVDVQNVIERDHKLVVMAKERDRDAP